MPLLPTISIQKGDYGIVMLTNQSSFLKHFAVLANWPMGIRLRHSPLVPVLPRSGPDEASPSDSFNLRPDHNNSIAPQSVTPPSCLAWLSSLLARRFASGLCCLPLCGSGSSPTCAAERALSYIKIESATSCFYAYLECQAHRKRLRNQLRQRDADIARHTFPQTRHQ
jgi:hypothetical protein